MALQFGTAGSKARSPNSESLPCQYITIAGLVFVPHMVRLMGPKGALVGAALEERRSMEKVVVAVKGPKGGAGGDSPLLGFGKSSWTSGELVGSGPGGAGRKVGLKDCGLDAGTK